MLKTFAQHSRLTSDSIFYLGAITSFVYPSANQSLFLQERTGHLRAQLVETHAYSNYFAWSPFFCFVRHFEFSSGLPLYTRSQTPVPRSPFPVPGISNIHRFRKNFLETVLVLIVCLLLVLEDWC